MDHHQASEASGGGDKTGNERGLLLDGEQDNISCKVSNLSPTKSVRNPDELDLDELHEVHKKDDSEDCEEVEEFIGASLLSLGYSFDDVPQWDEIEQPEKSDMHDLLRLQIENNIMPNVQEKSVDVKQSEDN